MGKKKSEMRPSEQFAKTWNRKQQEDTVWHTITSAAGVLVPFAAIIFFLVALFKPM